MGSDAWTAESCASGICARPALQRLPSAYKIQQVGGRTVAPEPKSTSPGSVLPSPLLVSSPDTDDSDISLNCIRGKKETVYVTNSDGTKKTVNTQSKLKVSKANSNITLSHSSKANGRTSTHPNTSTKDFDRDIPPPPPSMSSTRRTSSKIPASNAYSSQRTPQFSPLDSVYLTDSLFGDDQLYTRGDDNLSDIKHMSVNKASKKSQLSLARFLSLDESVTNDVDLSHIDSWWGGSSPKDTPSTPEHRYRLPSIEESIDPICHMGSTDDDCQSLRLFDPEDNTLLDAAFGKLNNDIPETVWKKNSIQVGSNSGRLSAVPLPFVDPFESFVKYGNPLALASTMKNDKKKGKEKEKNKLQLESGGRSLSPLVIIPKPKTRKANTPKKSFARSKPFVRNNSRTSKRTIRNGSVNDQPSPVSESKIKSKIKVETEKTPQKAPICLQCERPSRKRGHTCGKRKPKHYTKRKKTSSSVSSGTPTMTLSFKRSLRGKPRSRSASLKTKDTLQIKSEPSTPSSKGIADEEAASPKYGTRKRPISFGESTPKKQIRVV